jgi:CheY-like chemotaxis protein
MVESFGINCVRAVTQSQFLDSLGNGTPYDYIFVSSFLLKSARQAVKAHNVDAKIILLAEYGETIVADDVIAMEMPVFSYSMANLFNEGKLDMTFDATPEEIRGYVAPDAKVLIVDDIWTNLVVAQGLMSPYNMTIMVSTSGADASSQVADTDFDIIFMDHMMPDMDGIEATAIIRKQGFTKPIIALTANAVRGVDVMFKEAGMDDLLVKPIETQKLDAMLLKWLPKEKLKHQTVEAVLPKPPKKEIILPEIEGLDTEEGLNHIGGDAAVYLEVLKIFSDNAQEYSGTIKSCIAERNIKLFTTCVHALKSASANVGAIELSLTAGKLEKFGKEEDVDAIYKETPGFIAALRRLSGDIVTFIENQASASTMSEDDEDKAYLKKHLQALAEAAESFDADEIQNAIDTLYEKNWSIATKKTIDEIAENAQYGFFNEAYELAALKIKEIG